MCMMNEYLNNPHSRERSNLYRIINVVRGLERDGGEAEEEEGLLKIVCVINHTGEEPEDDVESFQLDEPIKVPSKRDPWDVFICEIDGRLMFQ